MYKKIKLIIIEIYIVLFLIGYFGMFKYLANVIDKYLNNMFRDLEFINGEVVINILIIIISISLLFPLIRDGIKNYKTIDFNEILTVFFLVAIAGSMIAYVIGFENNNDLKLMFARNTQVNFWISAVIFSPIIEELFCRGCIVFVLEYQFKVSGITVKIISAVIFSLLHFIKQKSMTLDIIVGGFFIYLVLGLGCVYVYRKTNNIFSAIGLHMMWNLCVMIGVELLPW